MALPGMIRKVVYFIFYVVGCCFGIALAAYGFLRWKAERFSGGPRWGPGDGRSAVALIFIGITIFAYWFLRGR
jgi:hypothetical protein